MKIRSSIKVALVVLGVSGAIFFGYRGYSVYRLKDVKITPINPGQISLIAVQAGSGYQIRVANQVAQLVEVSGSVEEARENREQLNAKRMPIREMMQSLQGDTKALARFVMTLNDFRDADMPAVKVIWKMEDLERAFEGDAELKKKLQQDLHVTLDGIPPDEIRLDTLLNGIVIEYPVTVKVTVDGKSQDMVCRVEEAFQSQFAQGVWAKIEARFNPRREEIIGLYREQALPIIEGKQEGQDIASAIRNRYNPARLRELAEKPQRILASASVLLNESFILGATAKTYEGKEEEILTDVSIQLTEAGKMRLWKYSFDNKGFQLMLIVDGVAISAPRISTELAGDTVVITQLPNEALAQDAVALMNKLAKK